MREVLQRIATGPTMSKDLSVDQARAAMRLVLEQKADPVQSALFLIALRMKRETDDEMQGVTEAILEGVTTVPVNCEALVTLVDPYDGYIRSLPASPFVPAVLAACGVPVVTHGIESIGPKHGLSVKRVLAAAGIPVNRSLESAARVFNSPQSGSGAGWCYLDQSVIAPELHALQKLRDKMVKRPCITTIEKGLMPLRAKGRNHFITGYVHKAYPDVYASLARTMGFDSASFIKGIEGGVVPTVAQVSRYFQWDANNPLAEGSPADHQDSSLAKIRIVPADIGISQTDRAVGLPDEMLKTDKCGIPTRLSIDKLAECAAQQGMEALSGNHSLMQHSIILGASVALAAFNGASVQVAAQEVRGVLENGSAFEVFKSGMV